MDAKEMARGDSEQFQETLGLEASQLKKVLGPVHNIALKKMVIGAINCRDDMTQLTKTPTSR